ncbi:MAG: MG2 domain-containing protein [Chitinophagaceae bacterium]
MGYKIVVLTLVILFSITSNAQNNVQEFNKEWQLIDSLITKKNLPKSALQQVKLLYAKAKQKKVIAEQIKCLIYQFQLETTTTEQGLKEQIQVLQKELNSANNLVHKSLLHAFIAHQYLAYFENNRWKIYNRSNTINIVKDDFTTWNSKDFNSVITNHYLIALAPVETLKTVATSAFGAIVEKGTDSLARPTLFDLLAHAALSYFKTDEANIHQASKKFSIKQPAALETIDAFNTAKFVITDSTITQSYVLGIYQQLFQLHQNNHAALLPINKERIEWVYQYANFINKDSLYQLAIQEVIQKFSKHDVTAEYQLLLAKFFYTKANDYKPLTDTSNRFARVKALNIIENALPLYNPKSTGYLQLLELKKDILQKQLNLQIEKVNPILQPSRALVEFKNIDTLYYRIINVQQNDTIHFLQWQNHFWSYAKKLPFQESAIQFLPATNDYQLHSVEIKIPALPNGKYALLSSSSKYFNDSIDQMAITYFYISDLAYFKSGFSNYYVVNRMSGKPIEQATVIIYKSQQDYEKRKNYLTKLATKTTNENGLFSIKGLANNSNISFLIETKGDRLHLQETEYVYVPDYTQKPKPIKQLEKAFFFTDRAIYRPGQMLFFKGIMIAKNSVNEQSSILIKKDSITVYLKDVNGKKVDSLKLVQNNFGSFSGKFTLPTNTLTGLFSLSLPQASMGNASFRVEQYKRPTFLVELHKPTKSYQLNDTITIKGNIQSLAGNVFNNAQVSYVIQRSTVHNREHFGKYAPYQKDEIAQGVTTSDTQGNFNISFIALPDETMPVNILPSYHFIISTNVTSSGGETRSANTNILVAKQALQLSTNLSEKEDADSLKKIIVYAKNFAGISENASVKMQLFALQQPQRIVRQRLWHQPDMHIYTRKEYEKLFPEDDYANDTKPTEWPYQFNVIDTILQTNNTNEFTFKKPLAVGYYKLVLHTTDKFHLPIQYEKIIQITNSKVFPSFELQHQKAIVQKVNPSESAVFLTGSAYEKIYVFQQTIRAINDRETVPDSSIVVMRKQGYDSLIYKVLEKDRGGVSIAEIFIKNNRVYTTTYVIDVPYNNHQLQIAYTSYRNKTEPNSKETWKVSVKGSRGEAVAAELLTTMYDASLDQFVKHDFVIPSLTNLPSFSPSWQYYQGFGTEVSHVKNSYYEHVIATTWYAQLHFDYAYFMQKNSGPFYAVVEEDYSKVYASSVNDVAAVGYGTQKAKREVSTVNTELNTGENVSIRGYNSITANNQALFIVDGVEMVNEMVQSLNPDDILNVEIINDATIIAKYGTKAANGIIRITTKKSIQTPIKVRTNFNETAFFFPQLQADTTGTFAFTFTMPESLTQWKWISLAHTKDASFANASATIQTQKKLMVQGNAPRFIREGDQIHFTASIANVTNDEITGQVMLELMDANTNTSVDGWFQNVFPVQYFTVAAQQTNTIQFPISIPFNYNKPLLWRLTAISKNVDKATNESITYSDGEEKIIPIFSNRLLVTETLPLQIISNTKKDFEFTALKNLSNESITHESLTVEYTSNPIWNAIKAIPYLMEYPYDCAEQTFNKYYANALSAYLVNKYPAIQKVMKEWKNNSKVPTSNLANNESFKQILLQETPWVLEAESEAEQQKNIALLFDVIKLAESNKRNLDKLLQMQLPSGGFAWFKGGVEDEFITRYILIGLAKLKALQILHFEDNDKLAILIHNALRFVDKQQYLRFQDISKVDRKKYQLSQQDISYLFMRSFYNDYSNHQKEAYNYYYALVKRDWAKQNVFNQASIASILLKTNEQNFVIKQILPSLLENAIIDEQNATAYWIKPFTHFWFETPVEHQSQLINTLTEIQSFVTNPLLNKTLQYARNWLIINKQTNHWKTTVATADACYALLSAPLSNIEFKPQVSIKMANTWITDDTLLKKSIDETGYFKKRFDARFVKPEMGKITVISNSKSSPKNQISYGAVYWKYFEDLDKIIPSTTALSVTKQLFIEKQTMNGKELKAIQDKEEVMVGDKLVIRLILQTNKPMEYLHLKDDRAANMEPVNVLSTYKYQDGLGYYEATTDGGTNFFINRMDKGTYVFEYPVFITHAGTFNVGVATIQCMYAPEFTSHSKGIKLVSIDKKITN